MTASQSLKIYNVLLRHFKSEEDANIVVQEIEQIVAGKFAEEKENVAPKSQIMLLSKEIELLRQEMKTGFAESESRMKSELNKLIIWIVATMLASGALFITIAKVFFDK